MKKTQYITIPQLAGILGISRIAVYRKVRCGQIEAERIGRNFAIPRRSVARILRQTLTADNKRQIDAAVKKTVKEYGQTLRLLAKE